MAVRAGHPTPVVAAGYAPPVHTPPAASDPVVARFAEGLVDQHRRLEAVLARPGLDFEWQPAPGRNSIGMLVAHNAITEVFWLDVAANEIARGVATDARLVSRLGLAADDDGMPAKPDGKHPAALSGWTRERYLELLVRTRDCTREVLATWHDADLETTIRLGERDVQRGWILYHVLEHFAQHAGQVSLLASLQGRPGA